MINLEKLRIPANYVLVKPKQDYDTYQIDGRETGILSALSVDTVGQRVAIYGTIMKVPEKLVYNGSDLRAVQQSRYPEDYAQPMIDDLKRSSVQFDVPMEVQLGDNVMFYYKNQIDCYKEGRVIHSDQGTLLMMKYDTLRAISYGEDRVYPLNASVFIRRITLAEEEITASGLIKLQQTHMGMSKKKKIQIGMVTEAGCRCKGYIDFPGAGRDQLQLNYGDFVYYDGRMGTNLEFSTHQTLETPRIVIKQKDIWGILPDPSKLQIRD